MVRGHGILPISLWFFPLIYNAKLAQHCQNSLAVVSDLPKAILPRTREIPDPLGFELVLEGKEDDLPVSPLGCGIMSGYHWL